MKWREKLRLNKISAGITLGSMMQLVLLIFAAVWYAVRFAEHKLAGEDLVISAGAVLFLGITEFMQIYATQRLGKRYNLVRQTMAQAEIMNLKLREQRHDFMNHLQVVQSLLEMDDTDEALMYIEKVTGDIRRLSGVLRTDSAAVNALLQAKLNDCDDRGVQMNMHIQAKLNRRFMEPWLLCRVLGNLLDNAIEAVQQLSEDKRQVELTMSEDIDGLFIQLRNRSSATSDLLKQFFLPGFTTKGSGRGMGLNIVKSLIQEHNGSVDARGDAGWVIIECRLPAPKAQPEYAQAIGLKES